MRRHDLEFASDADIIIQSRRHPEAFEMIYERHHTAVHRFLLARVGPDDAADLAADTFVRALHLRQRFDVSRTSALPWLFGIAANVIREQRRRLFRAQRAHRRLAGRRHVDGAPLDGVPARVDAYQAGPDLERALASLSDGDYRTLMLAALGGLTYQEIADELGIPIGTVRSRLARARTRLRELIPEDRANISG